MGRKMPRQKIVVKMDPDNIRKEGSAYDLPIEVCILASSVQVLSDRISDFVIMGELALDGNIRPVRGALPIAIMAREKNLKGIILPAKNAREAAIVSGIEVYGVNHLREVVAFLQGGGTLEPVRVNAREEFSIKKDRKSVV